MDFNTEMTDLSQASSLRKYFLFVDGRPLGPVSRRFVIDQLMHENIGEDAFLWREGMADWQPISAVKEFESLVRHLPASTRTEAFPVRATSLVPQTTEFHAGIEDFRESESEGRPSPVISAQKRSLWPTVLGGMAFLAVCFGVYVVLQKTVLIHEPAAFASLEDQPARILLMRQNLAKPLAERQWQWARMKSDPRAPQILLQTRWQEGTRFEVRLRGEPKTLLGALKASATVAAISGEDGLAMIDSIRQRDGSFLPEGQYHLQIHCQTCRTPQEELLATPLMVGDLNTENYQRRLKEFHELLRRQAKSELIELSEMSDAVLGILKGPRIHLQGASLTILSQIAQVLNGVSAATASEQYLYPSSYLAMQQLVGQIRQGNIGSESARKKILEIKNRLRQFEQGLTAVKPSIGENEWN